MTTQHFDPENYKPTKFQASDRSQIFLPTYYRHGSPVKKSDEAAFREMCFAAAYPQKQTGVGAQDVLKAPPAWWSEFNKLKQLREAGFTGDEVLIAVLDTGKPTHIDLQEHLDHERAKNFTSSPIEDRVSGHATHCAGIALRVAPRAIVVPIKVLGDNGSGSYEGIAEAILYCIAIGVDIISMSLGGPKPPTSILHDAIIKAYNAGIFIACAAGNDGDEYDDDDIDWPGRYQEVCCVHAINKDLERAWFSSDGKAGDVAAPGQDIMATYLDDSYSILSGTSMATPGIAGGAALVIELFKKAGKKATPAQVQQYLIDNAIDINKPGWDRYTGHGIADYEKTLTAVSQDLISA